MVFAAGSWNWNISSVTKESICLLTETHLKERDVYRLTNYVCHRTDQPTEGGGTAIVARRGIDH
jgi:hypothetical protein